jgi:hypothetical protein
MPSVFEARRRLTTSATETRRASNLTGAPGSRRDGGLDLLPFLYVSRPLPCGIGDTRRAARRPFRSAPVLVPPTRVGLPNRDTESNAPPRDAFGASHRVRIDVHGSKDRAKDASSMRMRRSLVRAPVHALCARMRDDVPLLGDLRTSAVAGAPLPREDTHESTTDRPRSCFRRRPAKSTAFPKTGMSFTVTTREGATRREGSLRPSRRLSRSRRPHVVP